ncbi:zinc finger matrin-type protein 5 isoform X2 [Eurosta solidaginis]|uniref:zinc finger matrin-type protein 5 isoform X2 n=1 Tax=Eurosta solidaginis TaxID=178769 RepID=UPI003531734A
MGGKSYYCDYCSCFLKNDINVRKVHNSGLGHKIAKLRYMRRFEEPRKVLEEECKKEPCIRFLSGRYCKFDLCCNSSHFNQKQLERLAKIAEKLEKSQARKSSMKSLNLGNGVALPWIITGRVNNKKICQKIKRLPESLKPINFNRMSNDVTNSEWGRYKKKMLHNN